MAQRRSKEKLVSISVRVPPEVYFWIEYAAKRKGLTVEEHIEAWIVESLSPWEWDIEPGGPFPLDTPSIHEATFEASETSLEPIGPGLRREDFLHLEAYRRAEQADRLARGQATRKRNREAQPKGIPAHIRAIAEARKQHPTLTLHQFSQLLFDQRIYQSHNLYEREGKPVSSPTLSVWLKEARAAGLLPPKAPPRKPDHTP